MQVPGRGKNLRTVRATPAPAWSIKASTSTPRAKAASSASRICAELRIGESNQSSEASGVDFFAAVPLFFFLEATLFFLESESDVSSDFLRRVDFALLLLAERLERERSGSRTLVWSMKGWSGTVPVAATRIELEELVTLDRAWIPFAISSASFCR